MIGACRGRNREKEGQRYGNLYTGQNMSRLNKTLRFSEEHSWTIIYPGYRDMYWGSGGKVRWS